jgi:hypothetical protein
MNPYEVHKTSRGWGFLTPLSDEPVECFTRDEAKRLAAATKVQDEEAARSGKTLIARALGKRKSTSVHISIRRELLEAARQLAQSQRITLSLLVHRALAAEITTHTNKQ